MKEKEREMNGKIGWHIFNKLIIIQSIETCVAKAKPELGTLLLPLSSLKSSIQPVCLSSFPYHLQDVNNKLDLTS